MQGCYAYIIYGIFLARGSIFLIIVDNLMLLDL